MDKKTDFKMSARKLLVFLLLFLFFVTLGSIVVISFGKWGAKIFQIDIYLATFIVFAVTCGVFGLLILNTIASDITKIREHFERYNYEEDDEDYKFDDEPPLCPSCGEKMVKVDDGEVHSHDESKPYSNVGRNDLCPCGSGKKYKKCCGR